MFVEDGDLIALSRLVQPRVEAELAFVMERDLAGPGVTTATALAAIAGALPAVEIVDSRVADWKIKLVDTVADNASSGLLVVGGRMRKVEDLDLRLLGVVVSRHGEVIDTGAGAAALGNPARCVAWLANKLGSLGAGLQGRRHRPARCRAQDGAGEPGRRVPRGVRPPRRGDRALLDRTAELTAWPITATARSPTP